MIKYKNQIKLQLIKVMILVLSCPVVLQLDKDLIKNQ